MLNEESEEEDWKQNRYSNKFVQQISIQIIYYISVINFLFINFKVQIIQHITIVEMLTWV